MLLQPLLHSVVVLAMRSEIQYGTALAPLANPTVDSRGADRTKKCGKDGHRGVAALLRISSARLAKGVWGGGLVAQVILLSLLHGFAWLLSTGNIVPQESLKVLAAPSIEARERWRPASKCIHVVASTAHDEIEFGAIGSLASLKHYLFIGGTEI